MINDYLSIRNQTDHHVSSRTPAFTLPPRSCTQRPPDFEHWPPLTHSPISEKGCFDTLVKSVLNHYYPRPTHSLESGLSCLWQLRVGFGREQFHVDDFKASGFKISSSIEIASFINAWMHLHEAVLGRYQPSRLVPWALAPILWISFEIWTNTNILFSQCPPDDIRELKNPWSMLYPSVSLTLMIPTLV